MTGIFLFVEDQEAFAVKAVEAILGAYPDESILILQYFGYIVTAKAIRLTILSKGIKFPGLPEGPVCKSTRCKQQSAK
jgi:hypothetical protein